MDAHTREWIRSLQTTAHGTAPLPALLAANVEIPVYVSYTRGIDWVQVMPLELVLRRKGTGYKFKLTELPCIGQPRGGLCFLLAHEGSPDAHWTPRGSGFAIGEGHCWFDSVRQELQRELPSHPAASSYQAARQWFANAFFWRCKADSRFAGALNRFLPNPSAPPTA